ncbi:MAG: nucleoside hydrolase [Candidatus Poribacteria bacterium]|nr:nucleoside hydrolase [Candidatus Poribacteria bacterium]
MRRILLDTDTGVDDALAILLAMRSPEVRVEAITAVHGNIPVETAAANIGRVLDVCQPESRPPVAMGAARPLKRHPVHADDVHGSDGLGGATALLKPDGSLRYPPSSVPLDPRSATEVICETLRRAPNEVTLVAVGPLTNVAQAWRADPDALRSAREIVVMGGAFRRFGNMSPVAEFNVFADPHAAAEVFDSGLPVTLFPLDVTEQVVLTREAVGRAHGELAAFVRDITDATMAFGERVEAIQGMYVHDALTVAYLIDPSLFGFVERRVEVETVGQVAYGQTVADLRETPRFRGEPTVKIVVSVEADAVIELLIDRTL